MRLFIVLVALAFATSQPAAAISCPTSMFVINFESNSTSLSNEARETLGATYNRTLQCQNPALTITGHAADSLAGERSMVVRDELIALGLSAAVPVNITLAGLLGDESGTPDQVTIEIVYSR